MRQGFIKVAALTPKVTVADTQANRKEICRLMDEAEAKGAKILVFPELCITGYTCGDLFLQNLLLGSVLSAGASSGGKKGTACDCKIYAAQGLSGFCGTSAGI